MRVSPYCKRQLRGDKVKIQPWHGTSGRYFLPLLTFLEMEILEGCRAKQASLLQPLSRVFWQAVEHKVLKNLGPSVLLFLPHEALTCFMNIRAKELYCGHGENREFLQVKLHVVHRAWSWKKQRLSYRWLRTLNLISYIGSSPPYRIRCIKSK